MSANSQKQTFRRARRVRNSPNIRCEQPPLKKNLFLGAGQAVACRLGAGCTETSSFRYTYSAAWGCLASVCSSRSICRKI